MRVRKGNAQGDDKGGRERKMKTMKRKREQVSERVRVVVSGQNENREEVILLFSPVQQKCQTQKNRRIKLESSSVLSSAHLTSQAAVCSSAIEVIKQTV